MADTILFELVSPERVLVSEQVTEVQIPAREGFIGVLPGHAPLLVELMAGGVLTYMSGGVRKVIALFGGFAEILPDRVRILADAAERKEEIDLAAAQAELVTAQKQVDSMMAGAADPAVALDQAMQAQARVDAVTKH
ncbi:MAG TPA: ATP synthase F1 subunit epsilon [Bryobacteraceae bacterium]|jgi:F-type H+-transporting ATPase subunit epsilon|nr:ATP synthase F1 subunit epsilon [Bryobacteraceae bacterium]